jgi:hypothetical protein
MFVSVFSFYFILFIVFQINSNKIPKRIITWWLRCPRECGGRSCQSRTGWCSHWKKRGCEEAVMGVIGQDSGGGCESVDVRVKWSAREVRGVEHQGRYWMWRTHSRYAAEYIWWREMSQHHVGHAGVPTQRGHWACLWKSVSGVQQVCWCFSFAGFRRLPGGHLKKN